MPVISSPKPGFRQSCSVCFTFSTGRNVYLPLPVFSHPGNTGMSEIGTAVPSGQPAFPCLVQLDDQKAGHSHDENENPVSHTRGSGIEYFLKPGDIGVYQLQDGEYADGNIYAPVAGKYPCRQRRRLEETAIEQVGDLADDDGGGGDGPGRDGDFLRFSVPSQTAAMRPA